MPPKRRSKSAVASAVASAPQDGPPAWAVHLTKLVEDQKAVAKKTADDLDACRKELSEATAEIQRLKSSKPLQAPSQFTFKKKSCEDQHKFASDLQSRLDGALQDLPDGPAKTAIEESKCLVEKRQKLIKIADCHDWQTVQLYTGEDDLADDEEDAKKIRRAESAASKTETSSSSI